MAEAWSQSQALHDALAITTGGKTPGAFRACALSANGRRALTCSDDRTCRLFELETGREVVRLQGHTDSVTGCALSVNGRRALTCSETRPVTFGSWRQGSRPCCLQGTLALSAAVRYPGAESVR